MFFPRKPSSKNGVSLPALALEDNFAKTRETPEGTSCLGQDVKTHCLLSGMVAQRLVNLFPDWLKAAWLPKETALLAASHDIGKVSPTFQEKIRRATSGYTNNSLDALKNANPELEKLWGFHAGTGQISATAWTRSSRVPAVIGCHHGSLPKTGFYRPTDSVLGGASWQREREKLFNLLKENFDANDFPTLSSDLQARVIAGLTSVADWISSGLPLSNLDAPDSDVVEKTVRLAGFSKHEFRPNLSFQDIFGFRPNAAQEALALRCTRPGIYILEAPMGVGKTEAALYAAYKMLASNQACGLYFALPTQATSNAILPRVNHFLEKILAPHDECRNALLVHSRSALALSAMGADAAPDGSWFSSSKRALLSPFAVGTIDQALMAAMAVRFSTVRTFGLFGKVVILDEVHTYDMYTGTILEALVDALRKLDCTVIILSATLTRDRRAALLGTSSVGSGDYPLLTSVASSEDPAQDIKETTFASARDKRVSLHYSSSDAEALGAALARARRGEQVLWIENTVAEAQNRFRQLQSLLSQDDNLEIGLVHSRFTAADRLRNESYWINILGKTGMRAGQGRILVGTQVLEQSLDIDADFLVTRLCPTDMLLQRLGRLWRHESTPRPAGASCEAWILTPTLEAALNNPDRALGASARVYAAYVLCRTIDVWERRHDIVLPRDIRSLIDETYASREEAGVWQALLSRLEEGDGTTKGRRQLQQLASLTLTDAFGTLSDSDSDGALATRYGQIPTVDVILCRSFQENSSKCGVELILLDGATISIARQPLSPQERISAALKIAECSVKVPSGMAPDVEFEDVKRLSGLVYISRAKGCSVRIGVVAGDGAVRSVKESQNETETAPRFFYSSNEGYRKLENHFNDQNSDKGSAS